MKILTFDDYINEHYLNLNEKKGDTYSNGCVMLYLNFPKMNEIHDLIQEEDLYTEEEDRTYGIEDETHCTLLYGLHKEVSDEDVQTICDKHKFTNLVAYNASLFENDKYDVLKFDVRYPVKGGSFLSKCNRDLRSLPHTNDYPDYHPHITIAYIKSGLGKKYVDLLQDKEFEVNPTHIVYSKPNGTKSKFSI